MWESIINFGTSIAPLSNIATIIALFISIITLFLASGIRKSMLQRIERADFLEKSESYIASLLAFRNMFYDDKDIVSDKHYRNILKTLIEIIDDYKNLLPWKEKHKIKSLRRRITRYLKLKEDKKPDTFGTDCADSLHSISTDLTKERRLL